MYRQGGGKHTFYSWASASAGSTVSVSGPKLIIDSTGKVGIGTASPGEILTLDSSSNTRLLLRESGGNKGQIAGGGGGLYIQNLAGDVIFRNISDADTVRIKNDGKVGIGTTAPSAPCLLYTSPSPRDRQKSRMPSSA